MLNMDLVDFKGVFNSMASNNIAIDNKLLQSIELNGLPTNELIDIYAIRMMPPTSELLKTKPRLPIYITNMKRY